MENRHLLKHLFVLCMALFVAFDGHAGPRKKREVEASSEGLSRKRHHGDPSALVKAPPSGRSSSGSPHVSFDLPKQESSPESIHSSTSGTSHGSYATRTHRFARATLDTAFKHMLSGDDDRGPLRSFLTAFTGLKITMARFESTALPVLRENPQAKQTFLDVVCKDDRGRYFLVEMQVKEQSFWNPRALYYTAGVYSQQLGAGEGWDELKAVIGINILAHDRRTLPDGDFRRDFQLLDREHLGALRPGVDLDDPAQIPYLRLIQCELPRVNLEAVKDKELRQWLHLLKDSEDMREIPEDAVPGVRKAYERLEFSRWGSTMIEDYTKEELHLEDYATAMNRRHQEGREEGLEEGREEKREEIALNMIAKGLSPELIAELTGLDQERIGSLQSSVSSSRGPDDSLN